MSFWEEDPLRKKSFIFALILHVLVFAFFLFPSSDKTNKPPSKIVVRTIQAPLPATVSTKTASKSVESAKTVSSVPKPVSAPSPVKKPAKPVAKKAQKESSKPVVKNSSEKKVAAKPKLTPVKTDPKPSKELQKSLKEIEETIAKIATKGDTIPVKQSQSIVPKIALELDPLSEEEEYISSLVHHLQTHLELPDMGEVRIELTLQRNGSVEKVKVLSAESERNRKRLEEELPALCFPSFLKGDQGVKTKAFILTFCNEM